MNTDTALSIVESTDIGHVQQSLAKIAEFQKLVKTQLTPKIDFGVIPGTGDKPTLLKPGAEKIIMLMGLTSEFAILDSTRNFDDGFFQYQVRCQLFKNGTLITEGLGSANSREGKYAKQNAYTIDNTLLKMAKKRALVDATLIVASLSQIFTQDIEDMELTVTKPQAPVGDLTLEQAQKMVLTFGKHQGKELGKVESGYLQWLSENGREEQIRAACNLILAYENDEETIAMVEVIESQVVDVDDDGYMDSLMGDYP